MRVLLVTNDYPPKPGGIQQYLGNITDHHREPIRVLAPHHCGAEPRPNVYRSSRSWMLPTRPVRSWIVGHIEDFAPDVVVYGAPTPLAQAGARIREATGVPFVVMTHGAEVTIPAATPGVRQLLRASLRAADGLFSVSRYTAGRVSALAGRPATVLGAGVDVDAFRPGPPRQGPVTLGCVSRFTPRKGHLLVVAAAEELAQRGHDVEVLLVGAGRLEAQIRRRAAAATVPVRVEVGIAWSALPEAYRRMDIFVMPARSRWGGLEVEGLGIVYLEAAASGLAVIAGPSGGAPETVTPGHTGYIAGSVDKIVEAVELILERPEMGAAARAAAERQWTWTAVMARWATGLAAAIAAPEVPGTS